MNLYILFQAQQGPAGGGNQFLKALAGYLKHEHILALSPEAADVILFNSHHCALDIVRLKWKFPRKLFVHRIDGPMRLYNNPQDKRDHITNALNALIADATIFQSDWSRLQNHMLGLAAKEYETTILNAPDPTIFNRQNKEPFSAQRKVRLVATSWSTNMHKGFSVYQWLDEHLDFNRCEMHFIGNTPVTFKNISHTPPLDSRLLAEELKKNDIFITASQHDPCSNSLIEALHCGLPALALNDGGHPEIVQRAGECFNAAEEIPALLQKIVGDYEKYQRAISLPAINEVGKQYYTFILRVYERVMKNEIKPKTLNFRNKLRIKLALFLLSAMKSNRLANSLRKLLRERA